MRIKNIVFIGSLYPQEREDEIRENSIGGMDNAANNLQWGLLNGLDCFYPELKVVTLPSIRAYPFNYKKKTFQGSNFEHNNQSIDYCLRFNNLPLLRHLSRERNLLKKLRQIVNPNEKTLLIIYGIHSPFLKAASHLKNKNSNIIICLIAPDLPQFMSESKNPIYRTLKLIDSIIINKCLENIDSFVLLSDAMKDALKVGNRPWVRIEGLFNTNNEITIFEKEKYKTILYTGTLERRFGIINLLDSFNSIDNSDYRLWICGDGNTRDEIIERAKNDSRIKYFGQISYKEVLVLQKRATVLINPRTSEGEFTKYSFPSKTMEYLASGTPTILHRLKGIPNEYFQYCFVPEHEDTVSLKDTILYVCEKNQEELDEFGRKASEFIFENKNPISQVRKIYEMLE